MLSLVGTVSRIRYHSHLASVLTERSFDSDVNDWEASCLVNADGKSYAVSKWVTPKRTRSYPYARVYNTLSATSGKKVTVIPIIKDEGIRGDRDLLQWDTVSFMSLLNVYVILGYYADAEKHPQLDGKITGQRFESSHVKMQMRESPDYHSPALHWNMDQLEQNNLENIIDSAIDGYRDISEKTNVRMHNPAQILQFKSRILAHKDAFRKISREKAVQAQSRELQVVHQQELLGEGTKASIRIYNHLGGFYAFTVDDVTFMDDEFKLVECKHTSRALLPSSGDIKDGLLKMILYSNIDKLEVEMDGSLVEVPFTPAIRLTSTRLRGMINSYSTEAERVDFYKDNNFRTTNIRLVDNLMNEADENGFKVEISAGG